MTATEHTAHSVHTADHARRPPRRASPRPRTTKTARASRGPCSSSRWPRRSWSCWTSRSSTPRCPTIGESLHLRGGDLQWLVTAYLLMSGGGLLLGGRIADLLPRRRVFLTGMTIFTAASLLSGFAATPPS